VGDSFSLISTAPFPCRPTESVRSEVRYLGRYLADEM